MPAHNKIPVAAAAFGAFALLTLGIFLHALLVRERFEAGYLVLLGLMLAAALWQLTRR